MKKRQLEIGDIVQLNPEMENGFGGQLLIVTEPKSFGCQGYVLNAPKGSFTYRGKAYLRPKFENMEYIGRLAWNFEEDEGDE